MADVDISAAVETVTVAEALTTTGMISTMSVNPSIVDAITVAENVALSFTLKLYRGTNAVTITGVNQDWSLVGTYKQFASKGVPLKGLVLAPGSGGPDTFVIKDIDESGAYLYAGALSATAVIVYPGTFCRPMIDFSECTLSTGHKITFVW